MKLICCDIKQRKQTAIFWGSKVEVTKHLYFAVLGLRECKINLKAGGCRNEVMQCSICTWYENSSDK